MAEQPSCDTAREKVFMTPCDCAMEGPRRIPNANLEGGAGNRMWGEALTLGTKLEGSAKAQESTQYLRV